MEDNPEQQLIEKIKHCQKTACNLKKEHESLLLKQKSTNTTDDSDNPVKTALANYVKLRATKRLKAIDRALESNQQQLILALKQYLHTQSDLSTSEDSSIIQNDSNQTQIAKDTIKQQIKLSNDNNAQNEANLNLNTIAQALFTGTLPDDFYLHLMSVMGIQECLLSNRLVCSFWNELVIDRCHNQKSLKLFETFDNLMSYGEMLLKFEKMNDTSLILKSIGDDLVGEREADRKQLVNSLNRKENVTGEVDTKDVLTTLFPKVEQLVFYVSKRVSKINPLINVEQLLQFYAEQLTSLTIAYYGDWDKSPSSKLEAFSFPKLKSLNTFNFSPQKEQLLSLLPQLESLTLRNTEISLETLLRTGTQLRELNIIGDYSSVYAAMDTEEEEEEEDFSKRPPINTNLLKFTFATVENDLVVLEFISLNLTSLKCLKLDFHSDPYDFSDLNLLTSHLVQLHQLHSLTLEVRASFFLLDDNKLAEIKPLPSVRHLKLLLWNNDSLPPESMDLFSRALFTAFPKAEQVLIAFDGNEDGGFISDVRLDAATLAAFEDFADKNPNVVQLFRSKEMSKCTKLPNAVAPLLGHHRQVYEEYIEGEELFGVAICELAACLIKQEGEDGPNLKITLRPADRLIAMSNLLHLLKSKAFAFTFHQVYAMIEQMVECALKYGPTEGALFIVTCKCVLILLYYRIVDAKFSYGNNTRFIFVVGGDPGWLYPGYYHFSKMMLKLVEHFQKLLDDKNLLFKMYKCMVKLLKLLDFFSDVWWLEKCKLFKILLKLAAYYKTQQLNVLDSTEELLFQINKMINNQLKTFESKKCLDGVIIKLIGSKNRVYQVETVHALLRFYESSDDYFEWSSSEVDSDSSDSCNRTNDGLFSSGESDPEL